jgi:hypothetical protein
LSISHSASFLFFLQWKAAPSLILLKQNWARSSHFFTPLESPADCSWDEGDFLTEANTGFNAPCEPSR